MAIDDSSSFSSVEHSFRELDDVFLQSQARIWLGEVLHRRFDEQLSICDLLSDGELLFEVSKALWNMLLVKYMELNNVKAHMFIPVDARKSSGRYRPYSNVDSFLKVCKVLGLSGVDLFSPSDVVEKRDTRKVCICIRALSKKARAKQLNVPDFDNVTKTVSMPTYVVRCIRRSLELSTCNVTHRQRKDARLKFRQKSYLESHKQENESCLEESDEEKSKFSDTSYADFLYLESGKSPEAVNKYALTQGIRLADTRNQEMDKFAHIPGSAESLLLQYVSSDNQPDGISSPVCESQLIICDEFTPINHGAKLWHDNGEPERIDVSHGVGENALIPQNRGEIDHRISLSDMVSFRILTDVPFHISENCLCNSCMGTESQNSNTTPNISMCRIWRKFPDDVEASSTSSVTSVVGRVLDFDFDFDANSEPDDLRTSISFTPDLQQHGAKILAKVPFPCNQFQESKFETKLENLDLPADSFSPCGDDAELYCSVDQDLEPLYQISRTQRDLGDSLVLVQDNVTNVVDSIQETVVSKGVDDKLMKGVEMDDPISAYKVDGICNDRVAVESSESCDRLIQHQPGRKGFGNVKNKDDQLCTNQSADVHCYAEDRTKAASKYERKEDDIDCLAEANTNGRNDKSTVNTEKRPTYVVPLMKTVAKGTALISILFLLHLRNRSDKKKSSQIHWKSSGVGFSRRKGEIGSKIYPVEKFKFED